MYHRIVGSAGVRWAVAVVDARRIDEVNILEATMEAMREPVRCIVRVEGMGGAGGEGGGLRREERASVDLDGCYVVRGSNDGDGAPVDPSSAVNALRTAGPCPRP